jgi:hypothetical protein
MSLLTLVPSLSAEKKYHYEQESFYGAFCLYRFYTKETPQGFICVREVAFTIISDKIHNPLMLAMNIKPKKFFFKKFASFQQQLKLKPSFDMQLLIENCCVDDVELINDIRLGERRKNINFIPHATALAIEWLKQGEILIYAPSHWFASLEENLNYVLLNVRNETGENI